MRSIQLAISCATALSILVCTTSHASAADDAAPDANADLQTTHVSSVDPGSQEVVDQVNQGGSGGAQYRLQPWCDAAGGPRGAECLETYGCDIPDSDTVGQFYWLMQSTANGPWRRLSVVCIDPTAISGLAAITPAMVLTEFRKLTWPQADIVVQPVGGETLVNFPTNYYTENTEPTTQQVTLLGTQITIEATPTTYTWHFDDANTADTEIPGGPAPDPDIKFYTPEELEESPYFVTHRYTDAHVTVQPSVDVTYTGRYRIGGGAWTDIPATLTVVGDTVNLSVIEATPRLTG